MKNVWLWVGVICLVVGSVFACFTDIANDIPALAIAAFGLGTLVVQTWSKSEKKDWVTIVAIVLVCVGGFASAFAALSQDVVTKIITAVIALVTLLLGILFPLIIKAIKK